MVANIEGRSAEVLGLSLSALKTRAAGKQEYIWQEQYTPYTLTRLDIPLIEHNYKETLEALLPVPWRMGEQTGMGLEMSTPACPRAWGLRLESGAVRGWVEGVCPAPLPAAR